MSLAVAAIKDENADGKFDRLDPALDFLISQLTLANGVRTIGWNSVPGRTYQLEYRDQLSGPWLSFGTTKLAAPGELLLSDQDSSSVTRFYRARLVTP
jgi:hypothetical protein